MAARLSSIVKPSSGSPPATAGGSDPVAHRAFLPVMETQASNVPLAKGIDTVKLEKELNAMWAEMSAPEDGAKEEAATQAAGVVRACVLNLVVYAEGAEARAEVDELLGA